MNDKESNVRETLSISHNMYTSQFFLTNVKYTSHISPSTPTVKIKNVSTAPRKSEEIKENYITVKVSYGISDAHWIQYHNLIQ